MDSSLLLFTSCLLYVSHEMLTNRYRCPLYIQIHHHPPPSFHLARGIFYCPWLVSDLQECPRWLQDCVCPQVGPTFHLHPTSPSRYPWALPSIPPPLCHHIHCYRLSNRNEPWCCVVGAVVELLGMFVHWGACDVSRTMMLQTACDQHHHPLYRADQVCIPTLPSPPPLGDSFLLS